MKIKPSYDAAFIQLINNAEEYYNKGCFSNAAELFRRAAELFPDNADLCFSAGNALRKAGDFKKAAEMYLRAVKIIPDFFAAFFNLASSLNKLSRFDEAIGALEKALLLKPDSVETRLQLADLYLQKSDAEKAKKLLEETIELKPDSVEALNGLGNCAMEQNDFNTAKNYYCRSLYLRPDYSYAHYNLGIIMRQWEMPDEAVICFKNAIRFGPANVKPIVNLGETYQLMGEIDVSEEYFRKALEIDPKCRTAYDNLLLSMQYNHRYDPQTLLAAHREWGFRFSANSDIKFSNDRLLNRRLVIGYLSPDFCNHPVAYFLEPILEYHNRKSFEIHCYAEIIHKDERTDRFKKLADKWVNVKNINSSEVAEIIRQNKVDILIDTAGHCAGNRLDVFALRAAPIQINGIGYPGSTGCMETDYRISDPVIDPINENHVCNEKILYLPRGFCCYRPPDNMPSVNKLPALEKGYVTFGSLHTTARLNEKVIKLWCSVLKAVPHSLLLVCRRTLSKSVISRLSQWIEKEGVSISRIDFRSKIPSSGHLEIYHDIDISLDTLPWSGHTTACESLIMGVPMITLKGDRPAGRMVSSILTYAGLTEFIALSKEEFVSKAENFATNIKELAVIRSELRNKVLASALCDGPGYVAAFEKQLRIIRQKWCETG